MSWSTIDGPPPITLLPLIYTITVSLIHTTIIVSYVSQFEIKVWNSPTCITASNSRPDFIMEVVTLDGIWDWCRCKRRSCDWYWLSYLVTWTPKSSSYKRTRMTWSFLITFETVICWTCEFWIESRLVDIISRYTMNIWASHIHHIFGFTSSYIIFLQS